MSLRVVDVCVAPMRFLGVETAEAISCLLIARDYFDPVILFGKITLNFVSPAFDSTNNCP